MSLSFGEEAITARRAGTAGTAGSTQGCGLGDVSFTASPGHASVLSYEVRVRDASDVLVATRNIGKPTPQAGNILVVNMAALLNGLAAGNYTVSVAAIGPGGTDDSSETSQFVVPLSLP